MKAATKPAKKKQNPTRAAKPFTCRLTYPDGKIQVTWTPKPGSTSLTACIPGDSVRFQSPDIPVVLTFAVDSPFEDTPGPQDYPIAKGATKTMVVSHRFDGKRLKQFKFICAAGAVVMPGNGGTVPVHGGGD